MTKRTLSFLLASALLAVWAPAKDRLSQNKSPEPAKEAAREVVIEHVLLTNVGFALSLRARESADRIEMVIGFLEGQSIEMARRGEKAERPLTHDIFKTFLDRNGWRVERVVVRDVVNGAFVADLVFQKNSETQTYDARPSDAIALALRSGSKIFVAPKVFEQQKRDEEKEQPPEKRRQKVSIT